MKFEITFNNEMRYYLSLRLALEKHSDISMYSFLTNYYDNYFTNKTKTFDDIIVIGKNMGLTKSRLLNYHTIYNVLKDKDLGSFYFGDKLKFVTCDNAELYDSKFHHLFVCTHIDDIIESVNILDYKLIPGKALSYYRLLTRYKCKYHNGLLMPGVAVCYLGSHYVIDEVKLSDNLEPMLSISNSKNVLRDIPSKDVLCWSKNMWYGQRYNNLILDKIAVDSKGKILSRKFIEEK